MEQLKFPLDKLGKHLRCSDCRNLLSLPPIIVLKDTGKYNCGRCSLAGRDGTGWDCAYTWIRRTHPKAPVYKAAVAVRDLPYEELAKDLLFPCKNLKYGCRFNHPFHPPVEDWTNDDYLHETRCGYHFSTNCECLTVRYNQMSYSSYIKHLQSEHRERSCEKKWHSHMVTVAKNSEGDNQRYFYSSDNKIVFVLRVVKKGREFTFSVRSLGTERLFQFEIKPGKFTNNKRKRGEILLSHMSSILATSYPSVKLVLMPEDDDERVQQYEFQLDCMGNLKPEELVKIPVKDSDTLRCTKCGKYLSVKPVMATNFGFECGRCFTKTSEGDKVRMKAYEILAEMVVFPCEEPGCEKSFGIGEMKKHWDSHKSSEIFKNVYAKKSKMLQNRLQSR